MTDLMPIWKADIVTMTQTETNLESARVKENALLTTFVNAWNAAKNPSKAVLNTAFTAFINQYNAHTVLEKSLAPQLAKLATDMSPVTAGLTDPQKQQLIANRAQYMASAYILMVNLCLQFTQTDALLEAQFIYDALVADINAAWANKNSPTPIVSPIPSVIFDSSNALNLYVGPNVPQSIGAPASYVMTMH